ncbi:MAG: family 43 glycosylhydrolase [Phycisphaeraceae bacterium]|nr:MAG: family 43 glycosylhydrolase [Phycisphaeraceae bacterium]
MLTALDRIAAVAALALTAGAVAQDCATEVFSPTGDRYLFPYFQSNGETGVFLAVSTNGFNFREANLGRPILFPPQWPNQNLTRDPSIVYHDGVFHMVWTSAWTGNVFGYAHSTDLVNWSTPQIVQPFPAGTPVENVWAPELDYDPARDDFFVVFSSQITGVTDGHRPFVVRTSDFETFSDAEMYIDPGYSTIDCDQVYDTRGTGDTADDRWVMIFKNEVQNPDAGGLSLRLATRDPMMQQPWDIRPGAIIGPSSNVRPNEVAEGPSIVRAPDRWMVYWDAYGNGHYSMATSDDLASWTDTTDQLRAPVSHPRHGTVFVAPIEAVRTPVPTLIRTHMIYNGSFDEADGDRPRNWGPQTWAGTATFTSPADEGRGGSPCVKITTGNADAAWSTYAVVQPNERYRVSGWIKTQNVQANSGRGVQFNISEIFTARSEALTGTNDWTYIEFEFQNDLSEDLVVNCLFGGWGQSSGTAWFDDVKIEQVCPGDINNDGQADEVDIIDFLESIP